LLAVRAILDRKRGMWWGGGTWTQNMMLKNVRVVVGVVALLLVLGGGCAPKGSTNTSQKLQPSQHISIKYRETPVSLWSDKLEEGDVSDSSFIYGAFYDAEDDYMILLLDDTYYQYCSVPSDIWDGLLDADSHGTYYNAEIKGNYSCEGVEVPTLE